MSYSTVRTSQEALNILAEASLVGGAALPGTGTVTVVADAASNQTLLSSNTARKGFRLLNDSDQSLYVKYGATATTTDYSMLLVPGALLVEDSYTGRVDGIWAANSTGSARITELSI